MTASTRSQPASGLLAGVLLVWLLMAGAPGSCDAQEKAAAEGLPVASAPADPMAAGAAAVVQRYPARSIASLATADAALADVARERAEINARHKAAELACRPVFFMTRCIDAAKEKRRLALAMLRPVEIEANAFKRRDRVVQRDRLLEEKKQKAERDTLTEQNSAKVRKPIMPPHPPADPQAPADAAAPAPSLPRNVRTPHVAKPSTPSIDAATEARNAASYDRKAAESAQRQREIAAKKAEKEQDRARKKAEASTAAQAKTDPAAVPAK